MKFFTARSLAAVMLMTLSTMTFADQDDHNRQDHNRDDHKSPQQSATAVPEPEVYGMMLAGLGIVGFAARRKLKAKAVKA
ncbi:MAG TPA: PEP-CTERM sorting domain-containing protein [Methylophilaceae bacterium]